MSPFAIKEATECSKGKSEVRNTAKAFEESKNEVKPPRHITTINEGLAGQIYPGTNVEYKKRSFMLNGERIEGVFPQFDSKFETRLPQNLWNASDTEQFRFCTRQLEQIKNGEPRISGLTWHHNEISGKMQLVSADEHSMCRHTGGRSIWGGGSDCR